MTLRLYPIFQDELRVRELTNQFFNHSMQLLMRLGRLESEGIAIDESELDVIRRNLRERAVALKCKVCEMLGKPFDLDSGTELTAILVQAFGLLLLSFALGFSDSHISRAFLLDLLTVTTIRHGMMKKFCIMFDWLEKYRTDVRQNGYASYGGMRKYINTAMTTDLGKRRQALDHVIKWLMQS